MNDPLFDTTNDDNLVLHPEDLSFDDDSIETVVVLPSKLEGASNKLPIIVNLMLPVLT